MSINLNYLVEIEKILDKSKIFHSSPILKIHFTLLFKSVIWLADPQNYLIGQFVWFNFKIPKLRTGQFETITKCFRIKMFEMKRLTSTLRLNTTSRYVLSTARHCCWCTEPFLSVTLQISAASLLPHQSIMCDVSQTNMEIWYGWFIIFLYLIFVFLDKALDLSLFYF